MTEKRFVIKAQPPLWVTNDGIEIESACHDLFDNFEEKIICQFEYDMETEKMVNLLNSLSEENEQLKKGMIEVVDRYIKNVECNPPSSTRIYGKIRGALINIREDLRNLIEDLE